MSLRFDDKSVILATPLSVWSSFWPSSSRVHLEPSHLNIKISQHSHFKHIDELTCDSFIDIAEQNSVITELQRQLENDQIDDDSSDEDDEEFEEN